MMMMNNTNKYKLFIRAYCSAAQQSQQQAKNNLFNKLFPSPTLINPVLQPIYSVEPIHGSGNSNKMGTLFKDRLESQQPPSTSQLKQIDTIIHNNNNNNNNFENNNNNNIENLSKNIKINRDIDMMEGRGGEEDMLHELYEDEEESSSSSSSSQSRTKLPKTQLKPTKKVKQATLSKYHKHVEENIGNPNYINLLIQSTKDIQLEVIESTIKKSLDFEVESMVAERIYDCALGGSTVSTFISIAANKEIKPEEYYKRFGLFGFTINGIRLKILSATNLKTILVKNLDRNMKEDQLRSIFIEYFDEKSKDEEFLRMTFPQLPYNPHQLSQQTHDGTCHLTFKDHLTAIRAVRFASCLNLDDKMLTVNWSRYVFSEGTAAANLISSLERKKSKQLHEIELMKDMIDLKHRVKSLESQLIESTKNQVRYANSKKKQVSKN